MAPAPSKPRWPLFALGVVVLGGGGVAAAIAISKHDAPSPSATTPAITTTTPPSSNASPSAAESIAKKPASLRDRIEADDPFVALEGFSLQRTEVTRAAYAIYLASLGSEAHAAALPLRDKKIDLPGVQTAKWPVTWVTWRRADAFCKAIDARLPTSDEFTRAAGGSKTYPWGAGWPPPNVDGLSLNRGKDAPPLDVGTASLDVTPAGVRDLFGNVSEWTSTVADGLATVRGGEADESLADAQSGFLVGVQKVVDEGPDPSSHVEEVADVLIGFRCAR